ncbi:MAG: plastocyanin/azurin family copper-binding protein, partial [Anaerolineae bacterium]
EDHEGYANEAGHPWSHAGTGDQWTFPANQADSGTQAWGPPSSTGNKFTNGDTNARLVTGSMDLTNAPSDATMQMTHKYNWELFNYYCGYFWSGSWVEVSTDGGSTWQLLTPMGGYPGTMATYNTPADPDQPAFTCWSGGFDWTTNSFDISDYAGESDVRFGFHYVTTNSGFYLTYYQAQYWYIDDITIEGTAIDMSKAFVDEFSLSGAGYGATFPSAERVELMWGSGGGDVVRDPYTFVIPGAYKIIVDTWIEGFVDGDGNAALDDFESDNSVSASRETMFTLAFSDAEELVEDSDFTPVKDNGGDSLGWAPIFANDAYSPTHVWDIGDDATMSPYEGDDISLYSPVFDLSKSTSAKVVFKHRYNFFSSGSTLYDAGNVKISTDGGVTWTVLEPTSGKGYDGSAYYYGYYGNPLATERAFGGSQPVWVETQIRLDDYLGEGNEEVQLRWHMGGRFYDDDPFWQLDDIGIYALGFDLAQEKMEAPWSLELDEGATLTTAYHNLGAGDVGPGETVESVTVYGYLYDIEGNLVWSSDGDVIDDLEMDAHTGDIAIAMPAVGEPGVYRVGVMIGGFDVDGNKEVYRDLFRANNDESHALVVGTAQEDGAVLPLSGGSAFETLGTSRAETVPEHIGSAVKIVYDETDVLTDPEVAVDMPSGQFAFTPDYMTVLVGTNVTWTNSDTAIHTVTSPWFDSGDMANGDTFSYVFDTPGTYNYVCSYHEFSGMTGTVVVQEAARIDEVAATPYVKLWTTNTMLLFWAKYDLSENDLITLEASRKSDTSLNITLDKLNGFELYDGFTGELIEGGLQGDTKDEDGNLEWRLYYVNLETSKGDHWLNLQYSTYRSQAEGSKVRFQFRVSGDEGTAYLGGVQLIRTLPYGMFWTLASDENTGTIFPGTDASTAYYARNIGVFDNTLQFAPQLRLDAELLDWDMEVEASDADDGTALSTPKSGLNYTVVVSANRAVEVSVRVIAPAYDPDFYNGPGEPKGAPMSGQYRLSMEGREQGGGTKLEAPPYFYLTILKPDIAIVGLELPGSAVLEGQSMKVSVDLENYGNYAQNVRVYFYYADPDGELLAGGNSPWPSTRMTRFGAATAELLEPKAVLESKGKKTHTTVTATWEEGADGNGPQLPESATGDYSDVQVFVWANPTNGELTAADRDAGFDNIEEEKKNLDNNFEEASLRVVRKSVTSSSFGMALWGVALAGLVGALSLAVLRRGQEEDSV